ncbi:MAG: metal ABC transporter permease [Actinomycetes bacterium]
MNVGLELLDYAFMQRALLAALLVGIAAPVVGVFLVQRRLALIGDGLGHVALAGVAAGLLTSTSPVWTALAAAVGAAVLIEVVRASGRSSGDVVLAVLFYGGIAGGVVLISLSPEGSAGNLTAYLFGAITTTSPADVRVFAVLTAVVLVVALLLTPRLFAVSQDEEFARAAGLHPLAVNLVLAVLVATTVVVSMRTVGLLLISALMVVPNAAAQQVARSFRGALLVAVAIGTATSVGGVAVSYYADTPSGGTIVLLGIAVFLLAVSWRAVRDVVAARRHRGAEGHAAHEHGPDCGHPAVPHEDHVDYVHDGHRHAPHGDHYDEHGDHGVAAGPPAPPTSRGPR